MKRVELDMGELLAASRPPSSLDEEQRRTFLLLYCDIAERRWGRPIPQKALDQAHCRQLTLTAFRVDSLVDDDRFRADLVNVTKDMPLERQHRLMKLMHSVGRTLQGYMNMVEATDHVFELLRGPDPEADELEGPVSLDERRRRRRG